MYRFKTQLTLTLYLVALIFILTSIGGESEIGITPESEIFWFIIIVSIIDLVFQWRRARKAKKEVAE